MNTFGVLMPDKHAMLRFLQTQFEVRPVSGGRTPLGSATWHSQYGEVISIVMVVCLTHLLRTETSAS